MLKGILIFYLSVLATLSFAQEYYKISKHSDWNDLVLDRMETEEGGAYTLGYSRIDNIFGYNWLMYEDSTGVLQWAKKIRYKNNNAAFDLHPAFEKIQASNDGDLFLWGNVRKEFGINTQGSVTATFLTFSKKGKVNKNLEIAYNQNSNHFCFGAFSKQNEIEYLSFNRNDQVLNFCKINSRNEIAYTDSYKTDYSLEDIISSIRLSDEKVVFPLRFNLDISNPSNLGLSINLMNFAEREIVTKIFRVNNEPNHIISLWNKPYQHNDLIYFGGFINSSSDTAAVVMKLDTKLNIKWIKYIKTETLLKASNLAVTPSGNLTVNLTNPWEAIPLEQEQHILLTLDTLTGKINSETRYNISTDYVLGSQLSISNNGTPYLSFGLPSEHLEPTDKSSVHQVRGSTSNLFDGCLVNSNHSQLLAEDITVEIIDSIEFENVPPASSIEVISPSGLIIEDYIPQIKMICPEEGPTNLYLSDFSSEDVCNLTDSLIPFSFKVCNEGYSSIENQLMVSLYNENPTTDGSATRLATYPIGRSLDPLVCVSFDSFISPQGLKDTLYAIINDIGAIEPPFSLEEAISISSIQDTNYLDNLVKIPVRIPLNSNHVVNHTSDSNSSDGSILLEFVDGFHPPYSYSWSTGDTTSSLRNVPTGEYTVTITDQLGCSRSYTYEVEVVSSTEEIIVRKNAAIIPNPSINQAVLRLYGNEINTQSVHIYDIHGRLAGKIERTLVKKDIVLPNLETGLYFVQVIQENGSREVLKWVVL